MMINNLELPPPVEPGAADALVALLKALANPTAVEQMLHLVRQQQDRVASARGELDQARAAFEREKSSFYHKARTDEEDHRKRMAAELEAHNQKMAQDRASLDAEREAFALKVATITKLATAAS
jgi:hypothetical protein